MRNALSVKRKKMRTEDRLAKGYEFQLYVADLLAISGYLEGQIFSTGLPKGSTYQYYEALKRQKKSRYTSPDVMVMNKWLENSPEVEFRFGLACSRRDPKFDRYGHDSVTLPGYQLNDIVKIIKEKRLKVYLVFGRNIDGEFAVGVTEPTEPDDEFLYKDQSTGNVRRYVAYYTEKLWNWNDFLVVRMKAGDKEPNLELLQEYKIPFIGA